MIVSALRVPCTVSFSNVIYRRKLLGRDTCPRPMRVRSPYGFRVMDVADNRDQKFSSPSYCGLYETDLLVLPLP